MADYVVRLTGQDNLSSTIKNVKNAVSDLGSTATTSLDKFSQRFQKIEQSSAPLKRQLRDLKALMAEMNFKGLSNTEEFTRIAQYAGQVKDAMDDAGEATRRFANDTMALQAAAGAFQVVTGAATALTGAMSLFGDKNEEVAQAILRVQSALAILNGVQAVSNALNKDSALMQAMKALKMRVVNEYTLLNTKANVDNTIAEVANKAATDADAVAKERAAVATGVESAATKGSTIAQNAWNMAKAIAKALMFDYTGLLLVGAGALAAYAMSTSDATETSEAFNSKLDELMGTVVDNIMKFQELQVEYENCKGKSEALAKMVHTEKEKFKALGFEVKNANDLHRVLSNNTKDYLIASANRAAAIASEAEAVDILRKQLADLTKIYNKMLRGEEVTYSELYESVQYATGWDQNKINQAIDNAGFELINDEWYSMLLLQRLKVKPDPNAMAKLMGNVGSEAMKNYNKTLEAMRESLFNSMTATQQAIYESFEDNYQEESFTPVKDPTTGKPKTPKSPKSPKTAKPASGTESEIELTDSEVQSLINSWEGLNKIIEVANKKKSQLNKNANDYATQLKLFDDLILKAEQLKYGMIDQSTSRGLEEAAKQIKTIIGLLPKGSDELKKWQDESDKVQLNIYEKLKEGVNMNDIKQIEDLISRTLEGISKGYIKATSGILGYIDQLRDKANQLKIARGLEEAPETDYEQRINAWQRHLKDQERAAYAAGQAKTELDKQLADADRKLAQQLRDGLITQEEYNEKSQKLYDEYVDKMGELPEVVVSVYKGLPLDNIARYIEDLIANIDKQLHENDLEVEARIKLHANKRKFQQQLDELTKGEFVIKAVVEPEYFETGTADWLSENYRNASAQLQKIQEQYEQGVIKTSEEARQKVAEVNAELLKLGLKPIEIEIKTKGQEVLEDIQDYVGHFNDVVVGTVDSIDTLVKSIDEGASGWEIFKNAISTAEQILTSIGTVMQLVNTLTAAHTAVTTADAAATTADAAASMGAAAAKSAEATATAGVAVAETAAQNSKMGPFGWVAAIAGAVALAATLFSLIGKFAGGGIVGGNSYSGDKLIARVNSGEMILNQRQQRNLFNAIDSNRLGSDNSQTVSFRLRGADIYGALSNYSKIKGKSGVTTGII